MALSIEERLKKLQSKLDSSSIEERLKKLQAKLDYSSIEERLRVLQSKLDANVPSSQPPIATPPDIGGEFNQTMPPPILAPTPATYPGVGMTSTPEVRTVESVKPLGLVPEEKIPVSFNVIPVPFVPLIPVSVPALTALGIGMGKIMALREIESAIISKIKNIPYKPLSNKGISEFLPSDIHPVIKDLVDVLEFIGQGYAVVKTEPRLKSIWERVTKNVTTEFFQKKVYLSPDETLFVPAKGGGLSSEGEEFLNSVGISKEQYGLAIKNKTDIAIDMSKLVTTADKPWVAAIKNKLHIKPFSKFVMSEGGATYNPAMGVVEVKPPIVPEPPVTAPEAKLPITPIPGEVAPITPPVTPPEGGKVPITEPQIQIKGQETKGQVTPGKVPLPEGWVAKVGKTFTRGDHVAEVHPDPKVKEVVFTKQEHMDNPIHWNHEAAHVYIDTLPNKIRKEFFDEYIKAKKLDAWTVENGFYHEDSAEDLGRYFTDKNSTPPELQDIFARYFGEALPPVQLGTTVQGKQITVPPITNPIPKEFKSAADIAIKSKNFEEFGKKVGEALYAKNPTPEQKTLVDFMLKANTTPELTYKEPLIKSFYDQVIATKTPATELITKGLPEGEAGFISPGAMIEDIKAEIQKLKEGNESSKFGEKVRSYFVGERDVRIAQVNQLRDALKKTLTSKEQEALTFYRDFKGKEVELAKLLNDPTFVPYKEVIQLAMNPTLSMKTADEALTKYYQGTLAEGKTLGFLDSSISSEKYITHLFAPSEKPSKAPRKGGVVRAKVSKTTPFAKERYYGTVADAIRAGVKVKTINALDAMTIYGDKHAVASATRLFIQQLKDSVMGKYGTENSPNIPEDWVPIDSGGTKYFRNLVPIITKEGEPAILRQDFYVPQKVADAMAPILAPDFTGQLPFFKQTKLVQSGIKFVQLSLSLFHLRALNLTALGNEGLTGLIKSYVDDMNSENFLAQERDLIKHGGTTSVLGRTIEAYKGLVNSSIPSRMDLLKKVPGIKEFDWFAKKLTNLTFNIVQRKFKVIDYSIKVAQWISNHPNGSEVDLINAKRSIAKEINAAYGGLNWEVLGWNKATVNIARFIMLAPDWTFSNIFNAKHAFEGGPAGTAVRKFWIRSILTGMVLSYGISCLLNRKLQKPTWQNFTNVRLPNDRVGKEVYQNWFFAGAPGDMVNLINNVADFGVIQGFAQSLSAKLSPFLKSGIQIITNRNYLGQEMIPRGMGVVAGTARSLYTLILNLLPIPFSLSTFLQMFTDPNKQYTREEYLSAIVGTRPRHIIPEGKRLNSKGQLVPATPRTERPLLEQITTGKINEPIEKKPKKRKLPF